MVGFGMNLYANCNITEKKSINKSFYVISNDFNLINDSYTILKKSIGQQEANGTICEHYKKIEDKNVKTFESLNLNIQFTKKVIEGEWELIHQSCQKNNISFYNKIKSRLKYLKAISKSSEGINNKVKENIKKIERKCIIDNMRQEIYGIDDNFDGIPLNSMPLY